MLWWRNCLFGNWADPNFGRWICFMQFILREPSPKRAFRQPSLLEDKFFRVAVSQQKRSRICVSEPIFEQHFAFSIFVQNSLCTSWLNNFFKKSFLYPFLPPEVVEVSRGGRVHHGDYGVPLALVQDPPGINLTRRKGNYLYFVSLLWNWN